MLRPVRFPILAAALAVSLAACGSPPVEGPLILRVMTYNIHHGEDTQGGSNLDAVAALVLEHQPDLVALQEVDRGTARAGGLDLADELASRTRMDAVFGRAMDYDGGGYGVAVLSRLPVVASAAHPLPHSEDAEPRVALEVVVEIPNGEEIAIVATHLDHRRDPADRIRQMERIGGIFDDAARPLVLAGDLNAEPDSEPMQILARNWIDVAGRVAGRFPHAGEDDPPQGTFPSDAPDRRIDYVLVPREGRWAVLGATVLEETVASDHRPLLVSLGRFRLPGDEDAPPPR